MFGQCFGLRKYFYKSSMNWDTLLWYWHFARIFYNLRGAFPLRAPLHNALGWIRTGVTNYYTEADEPLWPLNCFNITQENHHRPPPPLPWRQLGLDPLYSAVKPINVMAHTNRMNQQQGCFRPSAPPHINSPPAPKPPQHLSQFSAPSPPHNFSQYSAISSQNISQYSSHNPSPIPTQYSATTPNRQFSSTFHPPVNDIDNDHVEQMTEMEETCLRESEAAMEPHEPQPPPQRFLAFFYFKIDGIILAQWWLCSQQSVLNEEEEPVVEDEKKARMEVCFWLFTGWSIHILERILKTSILTLKDSPVKTLSEKEKPLASVNTLSEDQKKVWNLVRAGHNVFL